MEKLSEQQLRYVQENRDRRVQRRWPVAVGRVAAELQTSGQLSGPAWRRRLIAVLAELPAAELLDRVSIVGVRNGVLKLQVAEPALLYDLRLRWEQRLINLLRAEVPEAGVHSIRFVAGVAPAE